MTDPRHHPSEALLIDLASGALELGRALAVRAHLGACPTCRASIQIAEAVGGTLLEDVEPAELSPFALEQTLARLDRQAPATRGSERAVADGSTLGWIWVPDEVRHAAATRRRWAAPGVWVATVTRTPPSGPRSYLLRVAAGMAVPRHTHRGGEFICVLKGAFEDRGDVYGPGDFAESDESVEHRPRVMGDGECVCLAAADSALVPRDLIGRLFQPFVGI